MRELLSKTFSALAGVAALSVVGIALWYVFGDLPNPLPTAFLAELGELAPVIRWPVGLAAYMAIGSLVILAFLASARIVLVGWSQFIAEEREESKAKNGVIREVGTLIAISVENGGVLDSATTMIETTEGFYRVFGKVDIATKGTQVTLQKDLHGLFNIKWLCFAGHKYQLTK